MGAAFVWGRDMKHPVCTMPLHYGASGDPFPPGEYWIVEMHPKGLLRPGFWCDQMDEEGRSGWSMSVDKAAGFASAEDARMAYFGRGPVKEFKGDVFVILHEWVD